ncbi:efflux RND transporter periplasmic adaptor subunit [Methylomarinum sp. Ch1-1]|uniref:Efflux RND transporter periplasmic adaptor subunit n=1 Tax=Methylomarinum roseum TaxID=3067653 RepID=A0AAU7NZA3_9GAMM|nr:efflux RND transporter periplasmic adaptor subunit [Methylomarinum sp. Ch1-1]MDP4522010.1 efflux RND transporter periplasmic adaptor subunit [Methylomarinum sp. Ch1-1]
MNNNNEPSQQPISEVLGLDAKSRRQPVKKWLWYVAVIVALVIVVFLLFAGNGPTVQYQTDKVTRGDLQVTVSATGTLAPLKEVDVGIEVSGTIKSVEADYNDRVEVGQVLAILDTTRLEAQALQSKAALASARAKVQLAQATVREAKAQLAKQRHVHELSGGKVPSQYDLDAARATLDRARADLAAAKAAVTQAQGTLDVNLTDLTKAVVKSPINGVVLARSVEPGQTVASQFEAPVLFTLAEDLTQMELQVDVDEADVGLVKPGQPAHFTVDAYPDRDFPAEIVQVRYGSETVDGVVTYKAVLRVDNAELTLRPGMTATALITVEQKNDVLLVANRVLRFTPPVQKEANDNGGLLGSLLPHPRRSRSSRPPQASTGKMQQVWTLRDSDLTPITITKGATNGIVTEIVAGDIEVGAELVSGQASTP